MVPLLMRNILDFYKIRNIFALGSRKRTKNEEADKLQEYIWTNFNMLPFALRWLIKDWEEKKARELLEILIKKKVVHAYPILVEGNGQRVAKTEHTRSPTENVVTITAFPLEFVPNNTSLNISFATASEGVFALNGA